MPAELHIDQQADRQLISGNDHRASQRADRKRLHQQPLPQIKQRQHTGAACHEHRPVRVPAVQNLQQTVSTATQQEHRQFHPYGIVSIYDFPQTHNSIMSLHLRFMPRPAVQILPPRTGMHVHLHAAYRGKSAKFKVFRSASRSFSSQLPEIFSSSHSFYRYDTINPCENLINL